MPKKDVTPKPPARSDKTPKDQLSDDQLDKVTGGAGAGATRGGGRTPTNGIGPT